MSNVKNTRAITRKFCNAPEKESELGNLILIFAIENTWNITRSVTRDESTMWKL